MSQISCFMLPTEYGDCGWPGVSAAQNRAGTYRPVPGPPAPQERVGAMGTRNIRGRALLVAVVALTLAVGCSSGGGAAEASRVEKPVLNVAVVPAVDSAGFFVALDRGLFKAQGLTVNFIATTSSETAIADQVAG